MATVFWVFLFVPLLCCTYSVGHEDESKDKVTDAATSSTTTVDSVDSTTTASVNSSKLENCTLSPNSSDCGGYNNNNLVDQIKQFWHDNLEMIKRTLYVLMGLTGIVVVYFGVKYCRMRRRKTKKYGIVTSADTHELQPLDIDDDDDDMTVFESNGRQRLLR